MQETAIRDARSVGHTELSNSLKSQVRTVNATPMPDVSVRLPAPTPVKILIARSLGSMRLCEARGTKSLSIRVILLELLQFLHSGQRLFRSV